MPSLPTPFADRAMPIPLGSEVTDLMYTGLLVGRRRGMKTLVKDGPLQVTLIALGAGEHLPRRRTPAPMTVQVLSGTIRVGAEGGEWSLGPTELLALAAGAEHEVDSDSGAVFLLTLAGPGSA